MECGGVLEERRQEEWKKTNDSPLPDLKFKGCEDHIMNLVSSEFEKRLIIRCRNWGLDKYVIGDKHISTDVIVHVMGSLKDNTFYRAFRGVCLFSWRNSTFD